MKNTLALVLIVFGLVGCGNGWDAPKETKDEPVESEKAKMVKQSKGKSRVEICNKFYNNMLPSEKKVFAVGRCLTDENYDPAIHKKELVAQKYEGNFELYEKAMKKMEMDKVKELQRLREANAKRRQISQAQQAQYNAYINQMKATCKSYGYSESNGMAQCVEREINAERARLNAQAAQQNRINQENFQRQQQGLRDLADIFGKMGEGNYGQPKTSICNFKSFEGGIISGDCKQLTIKVGNTTYWKMD